MRQNAVTIEPMDTLTVKNLRCFCDPGTVPLRPLTLLIGENSTGKTSFLAAIRLAWDLAHANTIDFNEEPFLQGAFDQIAHYRGGRAGRATTFEIGFETNLPVMRAGRRTQQSIDVRYNAEFRRSGSHPVLASQSARSGVYTLNVSFSERSNAITVAIRVNGKTRTSRRIDKIMPRFRLGPESPMDWRYLRFILRDFEAHGQAEFQEFAGFSKNEAQELDAFIGALAFRESSRPVAIAPVRTRPIRTYNPVSEAPLPEGGHVPMVLAKTYFEHKQRWASLKLALDKFGHASGLFSSLDIKGLGRHESDPFQIRLKIKGPPSNLIDVGYGVSQVLPILVDALMADRGDLYLLQQPEVHLHPKAQAALGSFLGDMVVTQSKRFVVETHSDYLVDRLRVDVREKLGIKPSDISILYFERQGVEVAIHAMEIDSTGNLVNAPPDYRQFFLDEERRFLGV